MYETIIHKYFLVLQFFSWSLYSNLEAIRLYGLETAQFYSWYYIPVTVQIILVQTVNVIGNCRLPIGQLSKVILKARYTKC